MFHELFGPHLKTLDRQDQVCIGLFGIIPNEQKSYEIVTNTNRNNHGSIMVSDRSRISHLGEGHLHWSGWGCQPPLQALFDKQISKVKN